MNADDVWVHCLLDEFTFILFNQLATESATYGHKCSIALAAAIILDKEFLDGYQAIQTGLSSKVGNSESPLSQNRIYDVFTLFDYSVCIVCILSLVLLCI